MSQRAGYCAGPVLHYAVFSVLLFCENLLDGAFYGESVHKATDGYIDWAALNRDEIPTNIVKGSEEYKEFESFSKRMPFMRSARLPQKRNSVPFSVVLRP